MSSLASKIHDMDCGGESSRADTTTAILDERGKRYGKFCEHAALSQHLKQAMHNAMERNPHLFAPDYIEALEMIQHKVARILNGDPNYADSWRDIAGYAQLVADRLEGIER